MDIAATAEHWIFDWYMEDEPRDFDRFTMDDGTGWRRRLAPLREELLEGDVRSLYLGWLAAVGHDELYEGALEPPVPDGLGTLTDAGQALVEFIEINEDFLSAASSESRPKHRADAGRDADTNAWLAQWSRQDLESVVMQCMHRDGRAVQRQLKAGLQVWLANQVEKTSLVSELAESGLRNVAQLGVAADAAALDRENREALEEEVQRAVQRQKRVAYLQTVLQQADEHWRNVQILVERKNGLGTQQAVRLLSDLSEACAIAGSETNFRFRLQTLLASYPAAKALRARVTEAGLLPEK